MTPVLSPAGTHGCGHRPHAEPTLPPTPFPCCWCPPTAPRTPPGSVGGLLSPGAGAMDLSPSPRDPRCPLGSPGAAAIRALSFSAAPFLIIFPIPVPFPLPPPHLAGPHSPPRLSWVSPRCPGIPCKGWELWWHPGPWGQGHQGSPRSPRSAPPGAGAGLEMGWEWAVLGWEWAVLGWAGNGLGWAGNGLGHAGWCWAEPCWGHTGL